MWIIYATLAAIFFGLSSALYKYPSVQKRSKLEIIILSITASFVTIFVFAFFFPSFINTDNQLWLLALGWALSFMGTVFLSMKALEYVDANVFFPANRILLTILSLIVGILFFADVLSPRQLVGVVISLVAIAFFSHIKNISSLKFKMAILLVLSVSVLQLFNNVIRQVSVDNFSPYSFLIAQYVVAFILVWLVALIWRVSVSFSNTRTLSTAGIMGFGSAAGSLCMLLAFSQGPFSLVVVIVSLSVVVTAVAAKYLFKEELTIKRFLLVLLSVLAVILMK